nr:NADH dehydrogenase subunit 6 [Extensus latus]
MKILIMKLMMIISSVIPFMINPMSMGLMLLLQTMFMILIMNMMLLSSWFVMITFLMMIGGLLILISYMSSIASNEIFKLNLKMFIVMIMLIILSEDMMNENQINEMQYLTNINSIETISMIKMYNKSSMMLTMLMVSYLLLTMIVVSMIVKHNQGPLRSKN